MQFRCTKANFYAKGKRSMVYKIPWKGKTLAVKKFNKKEGAVKEANFLKILNKYSIGPKLVKAGKGFIAVEFVEGQRIIGFIAHAKKEQIKKVLLTVLNQCRKMDKLKISKMEMTNPYKHIIVKELDKGRLEAVQIDFERCRKTGKPKNVTQFFQFLNSARLRKLLKQKSLKLPAGKRLIDLLRRYKQTYSKGDFNRLTAPLRTARE